jgi:hypothetical protein
MSTSSQKQSRTTRTAAIEHLIDGLNMHATVMTSIVIDGVVQKTVDVVAALQKLVGTSSAVETTRASWRAAVAADKSSTAGQKAFVSSVRKAVRVAFGNKTDTLADFGLAPPKVRTPRTPQEKAASAAKAKATREARHTMGARQKAAIKGDVTGVVVTPVTTALPATPATPANPGSGTNQGH